VRALREVDYRIWQVIFEVGLNPTKFNELPDKEKAAVYNSLRFMVKEIAQVPMAPTKRASAYKAIERRIERILFD